MGFKLRDYQLDGVKACLEVLRSKKKNCKELVVAPTGAGKSIYIAETVKQIGEPILILQPSKELLSQNYQKFLKVEGKASICCASLKTRSNKGKDYTELESGEEVECRKVSRVTYATVGTIKKYKAQLKKLGVTKAIVDEAHLSSKAGSQMRKLFKEVGITHVVGVTATPVYLNGGLNGASLKMMNRTRGKLFSAIRHVTQIDHLVKNSFWSKLKYRVIDTDESFLKDNSSGSDFTVQSQKEYYEGNNLKEHIIEEIKNLQKEGRKSILVFLPTIAEAEELFSAFPDSAVVHSKVESKTRDYVVKAFKEGTIPVVFNINVLAIGFDHPELDAIIAARPTSSIAMYYQQIGRGIRIHENKKDCQITDFSGNVNKFGRVEELTFENLDYYGWGMFNGKGQLLTDYPIAAKIRPTKKSLKDKFDENNKPAPEIQTIKENPEFTFGKFKGKKFWDIAKSPQASELKNYSSWIWDKYCDNEWKFFGKSGISLKNTMMEYLQVEDKPKEIKVEKPIKLDMTKVTKSWADAF